MCRTNLIELQQVTVYLRDQPQMASAATAAATFSACKSLVPVRSGFRFRYQILWVRIAGSPWM